MGRPKKKKSERVDKNDPMSYVGDQYKFLEEDGYLNNIETQIHKKPRAFPFGDWQNLRGTSYHKTTWVPIDKRREDAVTRRRLARDPNHPRWSSRYSLLQWWAIRITLLGSDEEGRQIVIIRKGEGEPIYLRIGRAIEVYYKGRKVNLQED